MDSYGSYCTKPTDTSGRFCKPQLKFLVTLFSTIFIVCGKVNFTNLSRYSELNEKTYRRQFQTEVDFARLNREVVNQAVADGREMIAVMDSSFLCKSGKATFGLDRFWHGCANRVERGLEVSVVGIVEVESEMAYALDAQQTLAQSECEDVTRMDQYLAHLNRVSAQLPPAVQYLAVDGAYAKESFVTAAVEIGLDVVSKLRCDANLRYLYTGVQKRRGRPRKYDGKVDLRDVSRFTWVDTRQPNLDLYTAQVWHVSLQRQIRVVYLVERRDSTRLRTCLLFSTDVEQDPQQIVQFYKLRFQIEFIFRDAKQFTGLQDCQARDIAKLEFHLNASFTALNLAKLDALQQHLGSEPFVFSMTSVKRRAFNRHLLDRFIANLALDSTVIKSHPNYPILCDYGTIAV
jgi:Transposase DDE domain